MAKISGSIVELDAKDKKILYELDFNARIPFSELAKKADLSEEVVNYRIKNLIDLGAIKKFVTVIDIYKIGYMYVRFFIGLRKVPSGVIGHLLMQLQKDPSVNWLIYGDGKYDLTVGIYKKSVDEIEEFYHELIFKYKKVINNIELSLCSRIHHFRHNYLYGTNNDDSYIFGDKKTQVPIDDTDRDILNVLLKNGRTSLVEIAGRTNLSVRGVQYRIKMLESKGVIIGYRIKLDIRRLGYEYYKVYVFFRSINARQLSELMTTLRYDPHIIFITQPIGKWQLEFEIVVKNRIELYEKLEQIRNKFPHNIEDIATIFHYNELMTSFRLT